MTFLWIFSRPAARPGLARARAAGSGAHGSRGRCPAERLLCPQNHGENVWENCGRNGWLAGGLEHEFDDFPIILGWLIYG